MVRRPSPSPQELSRGRCFRAVGAALVLAGVYFLILNNVAGVGLWTDLAFGALLDHGGLPRTDSLSYSASGADWIHPSWGAATLFYRLLTDWGDAGLFVLKLWLFVASFLTASGIFNAVTADDEDALPEGMFFLMGVPVCWLLSDAYGPTVDPHVFSYLGLLACLWILTTYRASPDTRAPWLLPPLFALWVNLDQGFPFGLFAIVLYLVWFWTEGRKKQSIELVVILAFCLGALLLNPYGWTLLPSVQPLGFSSNILARGDLAGWLYAALAAASLSAAAVNARDDRRFPGVFLLLAALAVAGGAHRQLAPYFLLTTLALGTTETLRLAQCYRIPERLQAVLGLWAPASVALIAGILLIVQLASGDRGFRPVIAAWNSDVGRPDGPMQYPIGAAAYLRERGDPARVWCPRDWGGFLAWSLYPQVQVSMDARGSTLFPQTLIEDHQRFWFGEPDVAVAAGYGATHILAPAGASRIISALDASSWTRAYEGPIAVLYAPQREGPAAAARPNRSVFLGELTGNLDRFSPPPP